MASTPTYRYHSYHPLCMLIIFGFCCWLTCEARKRTENIQIIASLVIAANTRHKTEIRGDQTRRGHIILAEQSKLLVTTCNYLCIMQCFVTHLRLLECSIICPWTVPTLWYQFCCGSIINAAACLLTVKKRKMTEQINCLNKKIMNSY